MAHLLIQPTFVDKVVFGAWLLAATNISRQRRPVAKLVRKQDIERDLVAHEDCLEWFKIIQRALNVSQPRGIL